MEKIRNMITQMKIFIKSNKILSSASILCLIVVSCYEYTKNFPEWWPGADFIFNLINQLSLAYLGSFVFYIMQVYIPEKRKKDRINECIATPIYRIIYNIESPINHFKCKVIGQDKDMTSLTIDDYDKICSEINPMGDSPAVFIYQGNLRNVCYKDYMNDYIQSVDKHCQQVLRYLSAIDPELILIIDDIYNSKYHESFKLFYNIPSANTDITCFKKELMTYYNKSQELKEYAIKNSLVSKDIYN